MQRNAALIDLPCACSTSERVIAELRIPSLRLLGNCNSPLGKTFEDQIAEFAVHSQSEGRFDAIDRETGAGTQPDASPAFSFCHCYHRLVKVTTKFRFLHIRYRVEKPLGDTDCDRLSVSRLAR